jgi:tetratricopeptide (TPR) repeat protein
MHMQVFNIPVFRELIELQATLAFGLGILAFAIGGLLQLLQRPRGDVPPSVPPESLTFSKYRDMLNSRERTICDGISAAAGDRLIILKAELAAVEDRVSNLADSFFMLKSELAQAGSALMSMQSHASQSEISCARTALDSGDTRPAELIFARAANSRVDIAKTVEAHYRLARLALATIDYGKGLQHLRQASEIAPDDLRVNASLAELVDVLVTLVDAEPLPPTVLRVLEELLLVQDRAAVAEQLYEHALAFYERAFGPDHPRTVSSLKSLARVYNRQQKHNQAEQLYERMLAIAERSAGNNQLEVAAILEKLAGVYDAQGRRECVWHSLRRVLMIKEAALGPNHSDVIEVVARLAKIARDLGRLLDAKLLYRRLLGVTEKTFGPDHSKVAIVLNELAAVCDLARDYQEAEALYRRTLSIRQRAVCTEGPSCVDILHDLAEVYRKQGHHHLAEPLRRRVQAHPEWAIDVEHPELQERAKL